MTTTTKTEDPQEIGGAYLVSDIGAASVGGIGTPDGHPALAVQLRAQWSDRGGIDPAVIDLPLVVLSLTAAARLIAQIASVVEWQARRHRNPGLADFFADQVNAAQGDARAQLGLPQAEEGGDGGDDGDETATGDTDAATDERDPAMPGVRADVPGGRD